MIGEKDAYGILGVKEGAGKDEITKRYNLLLKIYKSNSNGSKDSGEEFNIEDINKAYNLLMGYSNNAEEKREPRFQNAAYESIYKKTENIFYHYKFHMLAAAILLIIVGFLISGVLNNVEPELNIVIAGNFQILETATLNEEIKKGLPDIKEVSIEPIMLSPDTDQQIGANMRMKYVTLIAAGVPDVLILDEQHFEELTSKGAFLSLDSLAKQMGVNIEENRKYVLQDDESGAEHLYGIDAGKSELLKSINPSGKEMIAAIRINSKNYKNAESLMKLLVK